MTAAPASTDVSTTVPRANPWDNPRKARVKPRLHFSVTGLIYAAMLLFIALAAMNSQANLLFAVFGLMIGVLLVSGIISRIVLRGIVVRRVLPETAEVGRKVDIVYEVTNRKRFWPTLSLTVTELDAGGAGEKFDRQPQAYILHAAAGMRADFTTETIPLRRGWCALDRYQLSTSFPFGFIRRAITRRVPDRLLVHPAMGAVEPTAVLRFLSAQSSGLNQRPRDGGFDELYGAREYRPGDPPRTIHWRRSARTLLLRTPEKPFGSLVVKQMTRVAPPRLVLMVDTYVPPAAGDVVDSSPAEVAAEHLSRRANVERSLSVAASLITAMTSRGLSVGLVMSAGHATGDEGGDWIELRPGRGKRQRRDLVAVLAEARENQLMPTQRLVERGLQLAQGETTGVLITAGTPTPTTTTSASPAPATISVGRYSGDLMRIGRGNLVTIDTAGPELDRWVRFDETLDWRGMV